MLRCVIQLNSKDMVISLLLALGPSSTCRSAEPQICGRTKVDIIISDVKLNGWCPNIFANKIHIIYW